MNSNMTDTDLVKKLEQVEETEALKVFGSEKNAKGVIEIIRDTLTAYSKKPKEQALDEWVKEQFRKYPDVYKSEEDIDREATELVNTIKTNNKNREELQETLKAGKSIESWMGQKLEDAAKATNASNVGQYASKIDEALKHANQQSFDTFVNMNGSINQNKNLHGFIAENHHVNTFNIEAATAGSQYRAEMLQSTSKNSVDIVIKDITTGKIVKKYGAKYGQNSSDTQKYLNKGDYRGQRKLVADGQQKDIENSVNSIEMGNVKSKPLSYEDSRKIQKEIQENENIQEHNWDKVDKTRMTKSIVSETGKIVALHSLMQGGRLLGRRLWNGLTGQKNQDLSKDVNEWLESSWIGAKAIGIQTAVTTGTTIAVRKGLISALAKNTPVGQIANTVYVGIENVKVLYKMAKGEVGFKEGVKQMETVTAAAVGGIAGMTTGAAQGAAIGSIVGPVGTAVGGFIGGVVGSIAGSTAGEMIAKSAQKVRSVAIEGVKKVYSGVKKAAKSLWTSSRCSNW